MPHHQRTHEESRLVICLMCFKKNKSMRKISDSVVKIIKKNFIPEFDKAQDHFPLALCGNCTRIVYDCQKNNKTNFPKMHDYTSSSRKSQHQLRSLNGKCICEICMAAKKSSLNNKTKLQTKRNNFNKPGLRCENCLSKVGKGKIHRCTRRVLYGNAKELMTPKNCQRQPLQLKMVEANISKKRSLKNVSAGRPISAVIGNRDLVLYKKPEPISANVFHKIETNLMTSRNKTLCLAREIRKITQNRKAIAPCLEKSLLQKSKLLDNFFSAIEIDIELSDKSIEKRSFVYCNSLINFIEYVKKIRYLDNVHVKIGIDGGRGFLKLTLSLQCTSATDTTQSDNKSNGLESKKYKDSGVKKIFILGIVPSAPENHNNVSKMWETVNVNGSLDTIATDLKMANILFGLMSHSSSFPCTWCEAPAGQLQDLGEPRTLQRIKQLNKEWMQKSSGNKKHAKNYKNCANQPIVSKTNDEMNVIELFPPPELHLMLGVVTSIYMSLEKLFPDTAKRWLTSNHLEKNLGRAAFQGNQCKKLLDSIDYLRSICDIGAVKYVSALKSFNDVVLSCFGIELKPDFKDKINKFMLDFMDTGIRVTPKIHAVFYHVPDFCEKFQKGLGFFSEQAVESAHFDFDLLWNNYKV